MPRGYKTRVNSRLKIKRSDWLLADICPQVANHCALCVRKQPIIALYLESEPVLKFYNLKARPRGYKLEHSLKLKMKHNDWLLVDTCPQAANHCALF